VPKRAGREPDQSTYANVAKAKRSKNATVVVKDDGSSALVNKKDAAKRVSAKIRERLHDDIRVLFDSYLMVHAPGALAQILKEDGFTHPDGKPYLPHELIVMWKEVVTENALSYAIEKNSVMNAIESAFKDYVKKYVETIVAQTE
jgi:hypothetical protein